MILILTQPLKSLEGTLQPAGAGDCKLPPKNGRLLHKQNPPGPLFKFGGDRVQVAFGKATKNNTFSHS